MSKYLVSPGVAQPVIYVGRSKDGKTFTDKEELTDEILLAVTQYVQGNFTGKMQMTFKALTDGKPDLLLEIAVREA